MKTRILAVIICLLIFTAAACSPAAAPGKIEEHSLYSDYRQEAPAASTLPSEESDWDQYQKAQQVSQSEAPAAMDAAKASSLGDLTDDESLREQPDNESYEGEAENGFKTALKSPLSTFSADVDTASYSNIRRYLQEGRLPPPEAVRIEEMVNYFHYDYPEPEGYNPFTLKTTVMRCPWNTDTLLAVIGLKAKTLQNHEAPPSNLVFLIDVSGSMSDDNKLPLLKTAFCMLVDELAENDTVSIVTYSSSAHIVLEATNGSSKTSILRAIDNLSAGGNTAGAKGIQMAYKLAEENFIAGGNNRVILATDGDFNVGLSSLDELEELISQKKENGVFLSVLGFGEGNLKDDKMETLADKGNGNYSYIDSLPEAQKVLVSERASTLNTIAKDVKIQIEFNPAMVESYRLIGYENRILKARDFNDDEKDAGEVGSGHAVTALYEISPSRDGGIDDISLKYQQQTVSGYNEWMTVHLRYKEPDGDISRELQKAIGKDVFTLSPSNDALFAASVAEFGLLLKNSEYKGSASYKNVLNLAKEGYIFDPDGYRQEYFNLVQTAYEIDR